VSSGVLCNAAAPCCVFRSNLRAPAHADLAARNDLKAESVRPSIFCESEPSHSSFMYTLYYIQIQDSRAIICTQRLNLLSDLEYKCDFCVARREVSPSISSFFL